MNVYTDGPTVSPTNEQSTLKIIESKKHRTNSNMDHDNQLGLNSKILLDTEVEEDMNIEQTSPNDILQKSKNGQGVSARRGAHLTI